MVEPSWRSAFPAGVAGVLMPSCAERFRHVGRLGDLLGPPVPHDRRDERGADESDADQSGDEVRDLHADGYEEQDGEGSDGPVRAVLEIDVLLSLIHISEPTRP